MGVGWVRGARGVWWGWGKRFDGGGGLGGDRRKRWEGVSLGEGEGLGGRSDWVSAGCVGGVGACKRWSVVGVGVGWGGVFSEGGGGGEDGRGHGGGGVGVESVSGRGDGIGGREEEWGGWEGDWGWLGGVR
ncbi:hypothetical protein Tco_0637925 [Tanacetum coccineum]